LWQTGICEFLIFIIVMAKDIKATKAVVETKKNPSVEAAQKTAATPAERKKLRQQAQDVAGSFLDFIREQGVVGLAVGFVLGGSVAKVVDSLVKDLINPLLGLVLGAAGDLKNASLWLGASEIRWGNFVSVLIDFTVIAVVVFLVVKILGVNRLDKKKELAK
jgi:large conductance mechanosensitive channel